MSNQVVDDSVLVASFIASLQGKDAKTITAYAATVRAFVSWLATMPGGTPFEPTLLTEAAMRGYLDTLKAKGQAPRTRAKAITALQRFCRWAQDEGHIRRNPIPATVLPP